MKKIFLTLITTLSFLTSCITDNTVNDFSSCNLINPSPSVNETEIEMIKFMREEEKLAYDVYQYLYSKYGYNVFYNISKSEKQHMDQVFCLLEYYNITDPASSESGVFNNEHLQQLYNDLTTQGDISLIEALKVGATIEDVDIKDLMDQMENTQNPAILGVFESLTCGSRNHMRAFVSNLNRYGETYEPQFISQELFDQIISSDKENCNQ